MKIQRTLVTETGIIFSFLIISFFCVQPAFGWVSDWNYKIPITLTENSGKGLIDYQVLVTIDTQNLISANKM
ncbi:MAG: hypothetical protein KAU95_03375, partial [Candidatus Aenigmarchaeota archaeon]|nr:hypothetical protein [Candidatus Aenigmarchaeota archaeon]